MKSRGYILTGAAIACCVASIAWYGSVSGKINPNSVLTAGAPVPRPIPTTLVKEAITQKIRSFPGIVKAKSNVELAFSVDGVLVELKARESRQVRKGEVVARLDERDFRNAHDAARANFLRSDSEFKRVSTLYKKEVVSQSEFDTAKAIVDVARAEFEISKKAMEDTIIVAPFDGLVARRYVENNEHVKKFTPILALKDISEIEIVIQVPERLMTRSGIHKFQDIKASFDIDNHQWFPGTIKEYSVQADPITRTYEVAVSLQAPEDLKVLPGMTAMVKVSTASTVSGNHMAPAVALIPVESVFADNEGKSYIWRIPDTSGKPEKIEVTLGAMYEGSIEIMSGLEPGFRIATAGIYSLNESILVRPMKDSGEGLDG